MLATSEQAPVVAGIGDPGPEAGSIVTVAGPACTVMSQQSVIVTPSASPRFPGED